MSSEFKLQLDEFLDKCDDKDVISFESEKWTSVSKLKNAVYQGIINSGIGAVSSYLANIFDFYNSNTWFEDGEECEILRSSSSGWQKGKLKVNITLEFIPDEMTENQSPLDDLRQEINNSNS